MSMLNYTGIVENAALCAVVENALKSQGKNFVSKIYCYCPKNTLEQYLQKEMPKEEEPYYSTKISILSFIWAGLAALHKASTI